MKRTMRWSATILATLAAFAPAVAQQPASAQDEYVLQEDGTLVVGGDVLIDCPSIAQGIRQYENNGPVGNLDSQADLADARETLALCEQYGFQSSGGAPTPSSIPLDDGNPAYQPTEPQALEQASPTRQPSSAQPVLPATGGLNPLLAVYAIGALFLLTGFAAWKHS